MIPCVRVKSGVEFAVIAPGGWESHTAQGISWGATQASGTTPGTDMDAYQYIVRTPRGLRIGN
jgi:hypothetical protein